MNEQEIQDFWNSHPCGESQVRALQGGHGGDYDAFFTEYDRFRYSYEPHIAEELDRMDVESRRLLEVGLGEGADSERLIRRGALWSGVDLTQESVDRVRTRLTLRGLAFDELRQASVLELPFGDNSFDVVFSHGVLHHVPDIVTAQREIHRVLRPGGELVVMLYARRSLNYLLSIALLRRASLALLYPLVTSGRITPKGMLAGHVKNARQAGLLNYLRMDRFIHRNTDGPDNPYAIVYDRHLLAENFPDFDIVRSYQRFMHAPPLPVHKLPGERLLGWHLWAHLRSR